MFTNSCGGHRSAVVGADESKYLYWCIQIGISTQSHTDFKH